MSYDSFQAWSRHSANSQAIDRAFSMVARAGKQAIRSGNKAEQEAYTRLATLALAAYMESSVNEIVWYYSGLREPDRYSLGALSVENRWRELVRLGFARRRGLSSSGVPEALQFTDRARYNKVVEVIDKRIVPLANARNALAHGQWEFAFKVSSVIVDAERMKTIRTYSLWRLTLERNLLKHLVRVVHDLVATVAAHERDFDVHVRNLNAANERIVKGSRSKWERTMMARHRRRPSGVSPS
ncbi:hypothetical protein [Pseudonocardia adelaidensis]|uniref:hypothetical protein n=1 Tax=Pseudonocardia adelaidensis TaxID=648754 RepID=UPI0031F02EBD